MERMRQYEIFYKKAKTDFAVEGRYGQIHDDVENIDIYFELINKLIVFTADILQPKPEKVG